MTSYGAGGSAGRMPPAKHLRDHRVDEPAAPVATDGDLRHELHAALSQNRRQLNEDLEPLALFFMARFAR
jgi:hypothetical protein